MSENMLGILLRNKRILKKISVREMARSINMSASFLSDIELGRTNPSINTLRIIVDFLKLSQTEKANLISGISVPEDLLEVTDNAIGGDN